MKNEKNDQKNPGAQYLFTTALCHIALRRSNHVLDLVLCGGVAKHR